MTEGQQAGGRVETDAAADVRRELLFGGPEALDRHVAESRNLLVDRVLGALALFSLLFVPASVLRSLNTGWLPLYYVHVLLGVAAICLFLVRGRMGVASKSFLLLALFFLTGLSSLLSFGLAGSGMWWLVFGSLLGSMLYTIRAGVVMMVVAVLAMSLVGAAFCRGALVAPGDAAHFLRSPTAWATAILGASVMPLLVFRAVASLNRSTLDLLSQAARQRERIRELATHDALTGVPGLMLAIDRLEQALRAMKRSGAKVGLLFLDLDGFKAINDSLGHAAGNVVLQVVARRMVGLLRSGDTVARIGGDEFLVLLTGPASEQDVLCVANKVLQAVAEPIGHGEHVLRSGVSIGAAFVEQPGFLAEDVIRVADDAMYEAKRAGGRQVRVATMREPLPEA